MSIMNERMNGTETMDILDELSPENREAIAREAIRCGRDAKSLLIEAATAFAKKLVTTPPTPAPTEAHHAVPKSEGRAA